MIRPEHISEAVWRAAMSTYHKELRKDPGMAWQKAIAAGINAWSGVNYDAERCGLAILPLSQEPKA